MLFGKERDLPFEIRFVIEVAVAFYAAPGDAVNTVQLQDRMLAPWSTMMSTEVVSGRNVEMQQFHFCSRAIILPYGTQHFLDSYQSNASQDTPEC